MLKFIQHPAVVAVALRLSINAIMDRLSLSILTLAEVVTVTDSKE